MMKPGLIFPLLCCALLLGLAGAVQASPYEQGSAQPDGFWDEPDPHEGMGFRVIPLHEAAARVTARFRGRLIAAQLRPPTLQERARGVELVHELRLLTPGRDVLLIRMDARTGAFLEVRGAGLTKARRHGGEPE